MNEASLLWNLKVRYDRQNIYVSHYLVMFRMESFNEFNYCQSIDLHRKHPRLGQPVQNVRHLRAGYGQEIRTPNSRHFTTVSISFQPGNRFIKGHCSISLEISKKESTVEKSLTEKKKGKTLIACCFKMPIGTVTSN